MKRHALVVALACAVHLGAARPQQPPMQPQGNPSKAAGTVLKNKAPVTKEILKVSLPKPQEADLVERRAPDRHRGSPRAAGLLPDDRRRRRRLLRSAVDLPGLASFTASLMREGTTTKTSEQISEQLDRLAASVGVGAGLSSPSATVTGSGPDEQPRHRAGADGGRADAPVVPAGRDRPLQDAHARRRS